jgi:hypothetical protein
VPERLSILSPTGHLGFTLTAFVEYDPATAIKFTIRRDRPSGSPGERSLYPKPLAGAQGEGVTLFR